MPVIRCETSFLTAPGTQKHLRKDIYGQLLADRIAERIVRYARKIERARTVLVKRMNETHPWPEVGADLFWLLDPEAFPHFFAMAPQSARGNGRMEILIRARARSEDPEELLLRMVVMRVPMVRRTAESGTGWGTK